MQPQGRLGNRFETPSASIAAPVLQGQPSGVHRLVYAESFRPFDQAQALRIERRRQVGLMPCERVYRFLTRRRRKPVQVDVPNAPSKGTYLDLRLAPNLTGLGSNWDFVRYEIDMRGYLPVWRSVFAARLRARAIDPFGGTEPADVPTMLEKG